VSARAGLEGESGGGGDGGRSSGADGVDDFAGVDALQVSPAPRGVMRKEMTEGSISSVLAGMPALGRCSGLVKLGATLSAGSGVWGEASPTM
jgi:hypothetical protein